jgi:hypothetical protein
MKPLYRTAFQLERVGEPLNAVHEIAQACLDWVFLHKGAPRKGIVRPEVLGKHAQDFRVAAIGANRQLETRYWKGANERLWALRLSHPDDHDPGIEWCVELTLECTAEGAKFTCAQSIHRNDLKAGGLNRRASQPGIIPQLIARYGARVGEIFQLNGEPDRLTADSFRNRLLKDLLLYPHRYPFVILISPDPQGRPLVDASLWARKLSPLAFVFVAEDDAATRAFEATLGSKRLACWGGAIRVYRPGFSLTDEPLKHYYFLPPEIDRKVAQLGQVGFADQMVARLTDEACLQGQADFLFWPSWVEKVGQLRIQSLQAANHDDAALVKLYEEENAELRSNWEQAQLTLGQQQDELNILREWQAAAQRAHRDIREGSLPAQALRDLPEVDSVDQAIVTAERELSGRLEFHLNSKSERDSPFHCPTDVLYAFRWLAGTFRRSKLGHLAGVDLEKHFADYLPTWEYAPNQSKVTMGKNREWYTINYPIPKGQEPLMYMHLACGNDRKPERCMRIGFIWDPQRQIVAVGYVGRHQRNESS